MRVPCKQEEHTEKSKSATRGDSIVSLIAVSLVAVWLFPPCPITTGVPAGSIIMTSMTTPSKEIIILFISIPPLGLTTYYFCHITFVIYIVAKKGEIPRFFGTFGGFFRDLSIKW
jgi:hypothetical protein